MIALFFAALSVVEDCIVMEEMFFFEHIRALEIFFVNNNAYKFSYIDIHCAR